MKAPQVTVVKAKAEERVPANWNVTEVNGMFRATNSVTGRVIEDPAVFTKVLCEGS
jgi:hypothetical protein